MEGVLLRAAIGAVLLVMAWHIAEAVRKPEKRQHAVNDIIQIVAFLVFLVAEAIPLSTHGKRTAYLAAVAILLGGFVKFVSDAKSWR